MKNFVIFIVIFVMVLLLLLVVCSQIDKVDLNSVDNVVQVIKEVQDQIFLFMIFVEIYKGIEQVKQELVIKDIDFNDDYVGYCYYDDYDEFRNLFKVVIIFQGDLVIVGKIVLVLLEQYVMLVDYCCQIVGIVEVGMDIGEYGVIFGMQVVKEVIWGVFIGKSDKEIEECIKLQIEQIKVVVVKFCLCLLDMFSLQQKFVVVMLEFCFYVIMMQKDVDDCGKDIDNDD